MLAAAPTPPPLAKTAFGAGATLGGQANSSGERDPKRLPRRRGGDSQTGRNKYGLLIPGQKGFGLGQGIVPVVDGEEIGFERQK